MPQFEGEIPGERITDVQDSIGEFGVVHDHDIQFGEVLVAPKSRLQLVAFEMLRAAGIDVHRSEVAEDVVCILGGAQ